MVLEVVRKVAFSPSASGFSDYCQIPMTGSIHQFSSSEALPKYE